MGEGEGDEELWGGDNRDMINKVQFNILISVLQKRCGLIVTTDPATNIMTHDEWANDVIKDVETTIREMVKIEGGA